MGKNNERTCFGFFTGERACQTCKVTRKCKAILLSDGFSLAESVLEGLIASLPEDGVYYKPETNPEDPRVETQDILKQIFRAGAPRDEIDLEADLEASGNR